MKLAPVPHRWNLTPRAAIAVQKRLAQLVSQAPFGREPRLVCGLDAAFSPDGRHCIGGAVLWDAVTGCTVEEQVSWRKLRFPYIPGLLSFREAPAILAALRKLRSSPEILVCDGQGLAHPRRFGIACHVGVITGLPTIGCAKTRLSGTHVEPGLLRGEEEPLWFEDEEIGTVLRTKDRSKPLFVSVGHRISLTDAVTFVLSWARGHRLPEPTRLADRLVARERRRTLSRSDSIHVPAYPPATAPRLIQTINRLMSAGEMPEMRPA